MKVGRIIYRLTIDSVSRYICQAPDWLNSMLDDVVNDILVIIMVLTTPDNIAVIKLSKSLYSQFNH